MLNRFLLSLFLVFAAGAVCAAAPDKPASQSELSKDSDRVQKLENELALHQHKLQTSLETNDKRLGDLTALLGTQATNQGTHTTWVGNVVAMFGVGITLIVAVAGFFTYFNATDRAEREANKAAEKWFGAEGKELKAAIEKLKKDTEAELSAAVKAQQEAMETALTSLRKNAEATIAKGAEAFGQFVKDKEAQADQVAAEMLMRGKSEQTPASAAAATVVKLAVSNLDDTKPRNSFNAHDHYLLGVSQFTGQEWQGALDSFDAAIRLGASAPLSDQIKYLNARGITLGAMGNPEAAIPICDTIEQRYGKDEAHGVREQVAKALFNKGFCLSLQSRSSEEIAVYDAIVTRYGEDESPGVREQVALALLNKGIELANQNKRAEAIDVYDALDKRYGMDQVAEIREQVAEALFNKGMNLGILGKAAEAAAVFAAIEQRYGRDESPAVRELVKKAHRRIRSSPDAPAKPDEALPG